LAYGKNSITVKAPLLILLENLGQTGGFTYGPARPDVPETIKEGGAKTDLDYEKSRW